MTQASGIQFDFSAVNLNAPSISDIPVNTPLPAQIVDIAQESKDGKTWFNITQQVYLEDNKELKYVTKITPAMNWLMAAYLQALGQDYTKLQDVKFTAAGLRPLFVGRSVTLTFQRKPYTNAAGQDREFTSVKKVIGLEVADLEPVDDSVESDDLPVTID